MLNGHGPFQFWICRINFYTKNGDVGGYVHPVNKSFLSFWGLTSEVNGRLEGSKLTAGSLVRPLCRVLLLSVGLQKNIFARVRAGAAARQETGCCSSLFPSRRPSVP